MPSGQVPGAVAEFADFLHELLGTLDPQTGWYGVFARRDSQGIHACLDGVEVLPWDVVDAFLQDLAAYRGTAVAEGRRARAELLHRASVAAYDRWVGGREALLDRLEGMRRERQHAAAREHEVGAALTAAGAGAEAESLATELAWARDDHRRAAARCNELSSRLMALGYGGEPPYAPQRPPQTGQAPDFRGSSPQVGTRTGAGDGSADGGGPAAGEERPAPHPEHGPGDRAGRTGTGPGSVPGHGYPAAPSPRTRPRGARFAGLEEVEPAAAGAAEGLPLPQAALPPSGLRTTPRGARFAGAGEEDTEPRQARRGRLIGRGARHDSEPAGVAPGSPSSRSPSSGSPSSEKLATSFDEARETASRLLALRASGRSGEAHMVLCEAAARPAERLPLLAAALEEAGLAADVATLLWETACLPPAVLAAAAAALADGDRKEDCRALLRQAVARPAAEVAATVVALRADGRHAEAGTMAADLLGARTADDAAQVAAADPPTLVSLLLDAASTVSPHTTRDLACALRLAGVPGVPDSV
jgi:hypothetical protein